MILNQWRYAILLGVFIILTARADFDGRVVRILDGDTIETLSASGQSVRIRLAGIDAPEKNQPFGQRSRQALSALLAQKAVQITGDKNDQYGRLLGTVWMEGTDVNALQVKNGMAWAYRYHGRAINPQYEQLENMAKGNSIGLWSVPGQTEPWRWRQASKE